MKNGKNKIFGLTSEQFGFIDGRSNNPKNGYGWMRYNLLGNKVEMPFYVYTVRFKIYTFNSMGEKRPGHINLGIFYQVDLN